MKKATVFETKLIELVKKHGLRRFAAVFQDPDRAPGVTTRQILHKSGRNWCERAISMLDNKAALMGARGILRYEDDPPEENKGIILPDSARE